MGEGRGVVSGSGEQMTHQYINNFFISLAVQLWDLVADEFLMLRQA